MNLNIGKELGNGVVNLRKGETISLTKNNLKLDNILVGLGWEEATNSKYDFDLDASAFLLSPSGRVTKRDNFVFYGNTESVDGAVCHMGDNLSGGKQNGKEDSEQIEIKLSQVAESVSKISFVVTIHEAKNRGQNFGQVNNAYIRIEDKNTGEELLRYDLTDDYSLSCSVVVGEINREGKEWKFHALGQGMSGELDEVCAKFGINASYD